MQESIFTKIINGKIPSFKIAENENFLAFLDVMPLRRGHTLVIPKKQVDYIYDLDDDIFAELFLFSKKVAKKYNVKYQSRKYILPAMYSHFKLLYNNGLNIKHKPLVK